MPLLMLLPVLGGALFLRRILALNDSKSLLISVSSILLLTYLSGLLGMLQAGVFLINSTNTFESMAGGRDELFENFVWLPTWADCRTWLEEKGVSDERVMDAWQQGRASGLADREALYALMFGILERSAAAE